MSALDRLIDALAECIVARQGLPNRDRAKLVLAEIEAQGWRLESPKEAREAADEIERLRKTLREIEDSSNDPRAVREARAALEPKP